MKGLGGIAPIELAPKGGRLLILETVEEVDHELVGVMLHDGVELASDNVLDVFELNDLVAIAEGTLVEEVEPIAEVEVVLLGRGVLELGIGLRQVVVPHLLNGGQTLHEGIEVAVVAVVSDAYNSFCQDLAFVGGPIHCVVVLVG
jgi:hypothetical protein